MCFLYSRSQCPSTYDRRTYDSAGWVICLPGCLVLLWRRRITVLANPWVETATRSSILAWKIPWTEEPGGLHSMGPQRAGHDWAHTHNDLYTACRLPNVHPRVSTTDFLVLIFNSFSFEASDQAIYHSPWVFIYSKTQSHIFSTQIGWQIRCLKVWPWRGFLLLLSLEITLNDTGVQLPSISSLHPCIKTTHPWTSLRIFPLLLTSHH